jgi:hypothetical protein
MTTFIEARNELMQAIASAIGLLFPSLPINKLPIKWPDMTYAPEEGKSWFCVVLQHTAGRQETLGPVAHYSREGFGVIEIYCPLGQGMTTSYTYAQTIVNNLQKKPTLNRVWLKNIKIQEENRPEGAWTILNIVYNFTYTDVI